MLDMLLSYNYLYNREKKKFTLLKKFIFFYPYARILFQKFETIVS